MDTSSDLKEITASVQSVPSHIGNLFEWGRCRAYLNIFSGGFYFVFSTDAGKVDPESSEDFLHTINPTLYEKTMQELFAYFESTLPGRGIFLAENNDDPYYLQPSYFTEDLYEYGNDVTGETLSLSNLAASEPCIYSHSHTASFSKFGWAELPVEEMSMKEFAAYEASESQN